MGRSREKWFVLPSQPHILCPGKAWLLSSACILYSNTMYRLQLLGYLNHGSAHLQTWTAEAGFPGPLTQSASCQPLLWHTSTTQFASCQPLLWHTSTTQSASCQPLHWHISTTQSASCQPPHWHISTTVCILSTTALAHFNYLLCILWTTVLAHFNYSVCTLSTTALAHFIMTGTVSIYLACGHLFVDWTWLIRIRLNCCITCSWIPFLK